MSKKEIGIFGMATMGRNLAINIANKNYSVAICNRSSSKIDLAIKQDYNKKLTPFFNIKEFIENLVIPRKIFIMVQEKAINKVIESFLPYLTSGDILIDGGNSFFKDTIQRSKKLRKKGLYFIGAGISGGEKGALYGPSMMIGGEKKIYTNLSSLFKKISASFEKEPCVTYVGVDGSGHYVKMVHNGIEYADMQLISESYFLLKYALNLDNKEISQIFNEWNTGELNSYLIEITKNILLKQVLNHQNKKVYLIDLIEDQASCKGTGKWLSQDALELEEPFSLITESVFFRYLSCLKNQRLMASKKLKGPKLNIIRKEKEKFIEKIRRSLYLSKIIAYTQGFSQLQNASKKNKWNINLVKVAKIFRSGCIIQAQLLQEIVNAYTFNNNITNLLFFSYFRNIANIYEKSLREIVIYCIKNGISVPGFSSSIFYYDGYRSKKLPTNLIQAQRDFFGSHTYKRIDKEGYFHTNWE